MPGEHEETERVHRHLVAMDFSDSSVAALQYARNNVFGPANEDDILVLLHVVETPHSHTIFNKNNKNNNNNNNNSNSNNESDGDSFFEARSAEAKSRFESYREELRSKGISFEVLVEAGDPRKVIVDVAERIAASNVIVGSRGLGAIKKLFIGSVAEYVVAHAHCHVVVARSGNSGDLRT